MITRILLLIFMFVPIGLFTGCHQVRTNQEGSVKISESSINLSDPKAVWKKFLEVNKIWLNPHYENLSYTLNMPIPKVGESPEYINRVHIRKNKQLDWELDRVTHGEEKLEYKTQIRYGKIHYLFPESLKLESPRPIRSIQCFYQAVTWHTGIHELATHGLPTNTRIVETQDYGKTIVMESILVNGRGNVGLGLLHVYRGSTGYPINRVRIHIRIPEYTPILEEEFGKEDEKAAEIKYRPNFFQFGSQKAPQIMQFRYIKPIGDIKQWIIEAHFQKIENIWILKEGLNIHDGKTLAHIYTENIRTSN